MAKKLFFPLVLIAAAGLLSPPPLVAVDEECADLIVNRCETCHYSTRICHVLGRKSKQKWSRSVARMVRYGAKLSETEQKQLIECLFAAEPGDEVICR